jgi:HD-like signal output (HDOD) protein
MTTGMVAQAIATAEGLPKKTSDSCLVGGLLHDVGKLILASSWTKEYADVLAAGGDGTSSFETEQEVFGATHADIGAYLLWLWGLPDTICNAVAFHHKPAECSDKTFTAAGAIHVADVLERERSFATGSGRRVEMDMAYVTALGLADRVPEWRSICNRYAERAEA